LPSLFEVRRRLPTSATTIRRAGNQTRALRILAGTEASTSFLFFRAEPLPCGSGDTWRAALRPSVLAPVKVSPTCVGLPNRDATSNAPPPGIAPAMHSEDRRARVEGPSEGRVPECMRRSLVPAPGACAFVAHADDVPLLGCLRTSAVIGALACSGGDRHSLTDRPRPSFRRHSAKSAAFQKARMPFTVTTREGMVSREGIAPSGLHAGSLAHAAHTFSPAGRVFLMGIARVTVRSPAGP